MARGRFASANILAHYCDLAVLLGKLDSVRLQVHEHLLNTLLVRQDEVTLFTERYAFLVELAVPLRGEANILSLHCDHFCLRLIQLDTHDIVDGAPYIEPFDYLDELVCFQLSEAKDVLDVEQQQITRRGLYTVALGNLLLDGQHLLVEHISHLRRIHLQQLSELLHDHVQYLAIVNDRVERIAHFVRYSRVDQRKQLTLSFTCVIENLLRDVNEADHDGIVGVLRSRRARPLLARVHHALVNLEVVEGGHQFLLDASHARQVFDRILQLVLANFRALVAASLPQSLVEAEYLTLQFTLRYFHKLTQRVRQLQLLPALRARVLVAAGAVTEALLLTQ